MKPTYIFRLEFDNRTPLMIHSYKTTLTNAREGAISIKQYTNAKRVEIWKASTLELAAIIESK